MYKQYNTIVSSMYNRLYDLTLLNICYLVYVTQIIMPKICLKCLFFYNINLFLEIIILWDVS